MFSNSLMRMLVVLIVLPGLLQAEGRPLKPEDYGRWELLGRAVLSPGGQWLAVPLRRVDGSGELQVFRTSVEGEPKIAKQGANPAFSDDSRWLAYAVVPPEKERDKLRKEKKPIRNDAGVMNLESGKVQTFKGVRRFQFSGRGAYLALLRYRNQDSREGSDENEDAPQGADLLVFKLGSGQAFSFGNVREFAWQDEGRLLAFAVDAADQMGNGVQLLDPQNGNLQLLDSGKARFSGLSWRKESSDLAFYRSWEKEGREGESQIVQARRRLEGQPMAASLDPADRPGFPDGMRIGKAPIQWSDDGRELFFGIQPWRAEEKAPEDENGAEKDSEEKGSGEDQPEPSNVQVWHSGDQRIFPMQELQKTRDRGRTLLSAWHLENSTFRQLGTDLMESAQPLEGPHWAVERDGKPYAFENRFDRDRQDLYLIDRREGSRLKAAEGVWHFMGGSSTGRLLLYFSAGRYRVFDTAIRAARPLAEKLGERFVNQEYDTPVRAQKPPWGIAGWLKDDQGLLVYDRYDIWKLSPDGSEQPLRLTRGAEEEVRHRYLRLDPEEEFIDPAKPLYLSIYGEWTKRHGFARLEGAATPSPRVHRLLWKDKRLGRLIKAEDAEVFAYLEQGFDDSPDYWAGGSDLSDARRLTRSNPFQSEFQWGRSELIEYRSQWGKRLQGVLHYPAGYQEGKQYPLIVYVYERRSQNLHTYTAPTERNAYNLTVFASRGYFVLQPDIAYRDRDPGVSATQCVIPAVEAALQAAAIDPRRVGLIGHSWGGYQASFIPTQTNIFAASVAGAPLTNFFSMFGTIHWNQGMPESSHFETGQARMAVPYWEDMQAYVRNSSVMFIDKLETPMLVFFGDKDGTVDWHQGVEFYNYARRAGKNLVMLVYPGENHSARRKENQIDYQRRVLEWFGHYLKGDPAPAWITQGVPALERDRLLEKKPRVNRRER